MMASIENISVHVRVRPLSETEKEKGKAWRVESNSLCQADPLSGAPLPDASPYLLDTVFDGSCSTADVYERTARGLIAQVVEGFNSTVFAYGQTSSGKTHTMRGTDTEPGIIPLAVREIFNIIASTKDREFLLRVSYMELYNEDINDLLAPENTKLPVHEARESGVYVAGLREDIVCGPEQVLQLLEEGERHRHVGETKMNKHSSRSHTIFRMVVESRSTAAGGDGDVGAIRVSTLTLVDLAGSERMAKTGAEGQRAKEGAAINKSLLTLGTVINKLSEGVAAAGGHIPYRDSKLTRILQPSLGGNAKTAIICAITPAAQHAEESHSTLRFACRAKRVVNNATVNEVLSDAAVLKRQAKEIEDLRHALESSGNAALVEEEIGRLRAELLRRDQEKEHMSIALAAEKEERERAQRKVESMARMMLEGQGPPSEADAAGKGKSKRDNRRETWCFGAAQRKRPLISDLESLAEGKEPNNDGSNSRPGASAAVAARRSDGGALLSRSVGNSPPLKLHCFSDVDIKDYNGGRRSSELLDVGALQARVRELETANDLMQRELDAVAEAAQRTQQQLRDAEDELVSVADERDKMGPVLKESQWKTRQLERDLVEVAAEREEMVAAMALLEEALEASRKKEGAEDDEIHERLRLANAEVTHLRGELEAAERAKVELAQAQAEREMLENKLMKAKEGLLEAEEKGKATQKEAADVRAALQMAEERARDAEARARSLYEETLRLSSHISDLESRKRAPLYQKRQEEELRSAVEKVTEVELRATEAEQRARDARSAVEQAEKEVKELRQELDAARRSAAEQLADAQAAAEVAAQRAQAEAELVTARHADALAAAEARERVLEAAKAAAERNLAERNAQVEELQAKIVTLKEQGAILQAAVDEAQACADAAVEHVRFLEEKAEAVDAEFEKEKAVLQADIEEMHAEAAAAQEANAAALATTAEEREALLAVNTALEAAKAELEARVAAAAGALHAADELKELRRKYKEETTRLNQALKSATAGTKGNERAVDRASKDADRLRSQIKELEGKLRAAVADKNTAQLEKAAVERELRTAQAQADKLGKSVSRMAGVEERKRESIMVGFTQTKDRLAGVEDALARAQTDLEKSQFELQTRNAEVDALKAELEVARRVIDDASIRAADLTEALATATAETEALRSGAENLEAELTDHRVTLEKASQKLIEMETSLAEAESAKALMSHERNELHAALEGARTELNDTVKKLTDAEAQLPRIAELTAAVEGLEAGLTMAKATAALDSESAQATIHTLEGEIAALKEEMVNLTNSLAAERASAETAASKVASLESALEERATYVSALEAQINEAMAEGMELKAAAESAEARCTEIEAILMCERDEAVRLQRTLKETRKTVEAQNAELKSKDLLLQGQSEHVASLEAHINELLGQLETQGAEREAAVAVLAEDADAAARELAEWKVRAQEAEASIEETRLALEAKVRELSAAHCETMAALTADVNSQRTILEEAVAAAREESERQAALLADAEKELAQEREHQGRLSTALAAVQKELEAQKTALAEAQKMSAVQIEDSKEHGQTLRSRIEELEVQLEHERVKVQNAAVQSQMAAQPPVDTQLEHRIVSMQDEMRKSKRREEKLQALLFRLREDLKVAGGDVAAFDCLRDVRTLEYEMDRAANRASREKVALKEALAAAERRVAELERAQGPQLTKKAWAPPAAGVALGDKENRAL